MFFCKDQGGNADTQYVELANGANVTDMALFVKGRTTIAAATDRPTSRKA